MLAHEQSTRAEQAQLIVDLLRATDVPLLGTALVPEGSAEQNSTSGQGFAGLVPRSRQASANGNGQGAHPRSVAGPQDD